MATFHVIGDTLVTPEELEYKELTGELDQFRTASLEKTKRILNFSTGTVESDVLPALPATNFEPIGIGKPLSVEIMTIYTGDYRKFLGGRKDLVVVSGIKNGQTYDAAARAVNRLQKKADENSFLGFEALSEGTPIVFYSPSMDSDTTFISFEIMFDNFDTALFDAISSLLSSGAGLPVFLPAAPYLLGASQLIKLGGTLGNTLFAGRPKLTGNISVRFKSPVLPDTEPRIFVVYNEDDKDEFDNLKVGIANVGGNDQLRLVNKDDNSEYKGYAAYLIVVLDGRSRPELASFSPKLASAALLKKFYGSTDTIGEVTSVLEEAMQLYNDFSYRKKGDNLKKQLDKLPKDSEEYKNLKALYDAYAGNIKNDNFKLPENAV